MKIVEKQFDVVVCGGGMAGFCAAISAARNGARTCLVHDRPVFGGCASSEVRVTVHGAGAHHCYTREGGIIGELLTEERALNHETSMENAWSNSVWDRVLLDWANKEPNLTCYLNTPVVGVKMVDEEHPRTSAGEAGLDRGYYHRPSRYPNGDGEIEYVVAYTLQAETEHRIAGKIFIDGTGDAVVGDLAGVEWRMGSEAQSESGDYHAAQTASTDTMGNSIQLYCRDIGRPAPFKAPDWAVKYTDPDFFYKQGRIPKNPRGGFWWIELGMPDHTIYDNEKLRAELTRHLLGVWDYMKNTDPKTKAMCENYALDWFGQVPGKRESRRVMGKAFLCEQDVQDCTPFADEVAYGGWFLDLHTPGGLLAESSEPTAAAGYGSNNEYEMMSRVGPYPIPLGIALSKDILNLMTVGRCMSMSHCAMGTVRVQATLGLVGEACGIAAALSVKSELRLDAVYATRMKEIQDQLLRQGNFLLNHEDRTGIAPDGVTSSSSARQSGASGFCAESSAVLNERAHALVLATGSQVPQVLRFGLKNSDPDVKDLVVSMEVVESIWDYARTEPVWSGVLALPEAHDGWLEWILPEEVRAVLPPNRYVRITLGACAGVAWYHADSNVPGWVSQCEINDRKMRCDIARISYALQVEPPQDCHNPENAVQGDDRPYRYTNCWMSDPAEAMPQWLQLNWDKPLQIAEVGLTFSGNIHREYHEYGPFNRDSDTVCDFDVQVLKNGTWETVHEVHGNYHRHRTLPLGMSTAAVRLLIHATNGSPSATVYKLVCRT